MSRQCTAQLLLSWFSPDLRSLHSLWHKHDIGLRLWIPCYLKLKRMPPSPSGWVGRAFDKLPLTHRPHYITGDESLCPAEVSEGRGGVLSSLLPGCAVAPGAESIISEEVIQEMMLELWCHPAETQIPSLRFQSLGFLSLAFQNSPRMGKGKHQQKQNVW